MMRFMLRSTARGFRYDDADFCRPVASAGLDDFHARSKLVAFLMKRKIRACDARFLQLFRSAEHHGVRETCASCGSDPDQGARSADGHPVFDWSIPKEWNIRDAWGLRNYRQTPNGFLRTQPARCELQFTVHSDTVTELKEHLYTLPRHQNGFCLPDERYGKAGVFVCAKTNSPNLAMTRNTMFASTLPAKTVT